MKKSLFIPQSLYILPMNQQTSALPEEMASFFDTRAEGYEDHMREIFEGTLEEFYE